MNLKNMSIYFLDIRLYLVAGSGVDKGGSGLILPAQSEIAVKRS